jgi:hypothetical protein
VAVASHWFDAVVERQDEGIFVRVPAETIVALDAGQRPPVLVTIGGHTYRSTPAVYGGRHYLPLHHEVRVATGVTEGMTVSVTVELDPQPREVEPPADLRAALREAPPAEAVFASLSFTQRREYVEWVESAKHEETRRRRVERAVELLLAGRRTPSA